MKSITRRTKMVMYAMLILLTCIFARVSFSFFVDDLLSALQPQVERATIQVSKILPQLEENEQAVRDINDNLKRSRERVYNAHKDELSNQTVSEDDSVETVIDHTLSWMNRVTKLRVGREGHVAVVSKDDYSILAHPNEKYVGQKVRVWGGKELDLAKTLDLGTLEGDLSKEDVSSDYHIFYPESLLDLDFSHLLDELDAGLIGTACMYKDTLILCGVTLQEAYTYVIVRCFFSTLIFFSIAWVLVRYVGFSLAWRKDGMRVFCMKLVSYGVLGLILLFVATWYYQTIMDVTSDLATMNNHAKAAVETLDTYEEYRKELSEWLNEQYLEQCQLAAELVKNRGIENVTRQDLAEYAKELGVDYIYVFDQEGKVMVTNSPYDHFELSKKEEDQSYAFRTLLDGREYYIQDVREDELSGERRQYVGVSLRNEEDLADGFVQIAINPELRERLLSPINVRTVLDNLVIGLPDHALAIDKESFKIVATTGLGYEDTSAEDLGLDMKEVENNFNGYEVIEGVPYYSGVSESADLYLIPLMRRTEHSNTLFIALKLTLVGVIAYAITLLIACYGYKKVLAAAESEVPETNDIPTEDATAVSAGADDGKDDDWTYLEALRDFFKVEERYGFEKRWRKESAIPVEKRTPEMQTSRIIYRLLLLFSSALILFEAYLIGMGIAAERLNGFSYVLLGNWEKGLNLFSFSYCLFLACVLYVFQALINKVLYYIARVSDLRRETICLLVRNALRYACAIAFLYMGLAKLGVDTRALWASAGLFTLIVGLGAKDLVNDIIAGMFIIFEGTLKIGDYVTVDGWFGMVEEIGIRSTKIGWYADTKIFNNSSLRDIVNSNGEMGKQSVRVPISYEEDLLRVEKLLEAELPLIAERIPHLSRVPKYQGVKSLEDGCIMLQIAVYAPPYAVWAAARQMRREIMLLFNREHVAAPYDHIIVKHVDAKDDTPAV